VNRNRWDRAESGKAIPYGRTAGSMNKNEGHKKAPNQLNDSGLSEWDRAESGKAIPMGEPLVR